MSARPLSAQKKKPGTVPNIKGAGGGGLPWMTVVGVVVVIALVASLGYYFYGIWSDKNEIKVAEQRERDELAQYQQDLQDWLPSRTNPDPSDKIDGVVKVHYKAAVHVAPTERVAYDRTPPFGGPHDSIWAGCTGIVYPVAIRTENAVHSLEHGAVWIAYNPEKLSPGDVTKLSRRAKGRQAMLMSPYPGLDQPISLQSWGHQLKLSSADDPRIDQFISALRLNGQVGAYEEDPSQATYPEVGASCDAYPGAFDVANPPPFDPSPAPANAVPMNKAPEGTESAPSTAAPQSTSTAPETN